MLSSIITFGPQPNKAIVGENAFAHEAGIHQDGYLKEKSTYEIIDPQSVGVPESKLVLGKHSGRHALKQRTEDLGFDSHKEELDAGLRAVHAAGRQQEGRAQRRDSCCRPRSNGSAQLPIERSRNSAASVVI